jgi:dolichol-phosphate mannosyltransferase/undecaprenyl-phosphate 4-deoxy-4-formamido-L-arabinose transferase
MHFLAVSQRPELSIVIPVYRSKDSLPVLLEQLAGEMKKLGRSYEVVLVDDASPDNTWESVRQLASGDSRITAVQLMRNCGQAIATLCGLSHARGRIVVTMDDDLQHRPDQLPKLLAVLESDPGLDCVFGCFPEKRHTWYRNIGSHVIHWVNSRAFAIPAGVRSSSFRALRRPLVTAMLAHQTRNVAMAAVLYSSTMRVACVQVEHAARQNGTSNYTLARQLRMALDNLCNVTMMPLRAVSILGTCVFVLSMGLSCFYLARYMVGQIGVPGWTTVVLLQSSFAGLILLSVGIIGEYMIRILREVRGAPRFVERDIVGVSPHNDNGELSAAEKTGEPSGSNSRR